MAKVAVGESADVVRHKRADHSMDKKVSFAAMEDGTQEDYDLLGAFHEAADADYADRVLGWLKELEGDSPYQISRLEHCLQTATRAENDGADDETVVCALLHDIGDHIAPDNHSQIAAAMRRILRMPMARHLQARRPSHEIPYL